MSSFQPAKSDALTQESIQLYVGTAGAALLALFALMYGVIPGAYSGSGNLLPILGGVGLALGFGALRRRLAMAAALAHACVPPLLGLVVQNELPALVSDGTRVILLALAGIVMRGIAAQGGDVRAKAASWTMLAAAAFQPMTMVISLFGNRAEEGVVALAILGSIVATVGWGLAGLVMYRAAAPDSPLPRRERSSAVAPRPALAPATESTAGAAPTANAAKGSSSSEGLANGSHGEVAR